MSQRTKAVIFTHVPVREGSLEDPVQIEEYIRQKCSHFQNLMKCHNIGLVIMYITYGLEKVLASGPVLGRYQVPDQILEIEARVVDIHRIGLDCAVKALKESDPTFAEADVPESSGSLFVKSHIY